MFDRKHPFVKGHATSAAIPGVIMLLYSFGLGELNNLQDHGPFYEFSFTLFNLTMRIGGFAFLAVAAMCLSGRLVVMLGDAALSLLCGAIMVFCAAVWTVYTKSIQWNAIMFLIVGLMMGRSGLGALDMYRRLIITAPDAKSSTNAPPQPAEPAAPHPASQASAALPKDGEPPPPEGYLAALSKEKDD